MAIYWRRGGLGRLPLPAGAAWRSRHAVDRERLAAVQTPQGFRLETYLEAAKGRSVDGFTDDCSLMEQAGISVHTVEGDPKNIKITLPEDIYFAETILKGGMSDYNF